MRLMISFSLDIARASETDGSRESKRALTRGTMMTSQPTRRTAFSFVAGFGSLCVALMSVSSAHAQMAISNDGVVFPDGTEQTSAVPTDCPHRDSIVWDANSDSWVCETDLLPDSDLTGTTYCLFGQGTWLFADPGVSATITANPFAARLDFTSSTEVTSTGIYDPFSSVHFPSRTMVDDDDLSNETGTYTVVGNLLTLTSTDDGESETTSFIMTPDQQVFVSGFFERAMDGTLETWETGMIVGVRAANCDGLI